MRIRDVVLALFVISLFTIAAFGGPVEERITNLPQDSEKWYVSIIGEKTDTQYQEILSWFENGDLKKFRDQVHFITVTPQTPIYKARYATNVKGLPTIRIQDAEGIRIYEEVGNKIPSTPRLLNYTIARHINEYMVQRRHNNKPDQKPDEVKPPLSDSDPTPQPILNIGVPNIEVPAWYTLPGLNEDEIKGVIIIALLVLLILFPWRKV